VEPVAKATSLRLVAETPKRTSWQTTLPSMPMFATARPPLRITKALSAASALGPSAAEAAAGAGKSSTSCDAVIKGAKTAPASRLRRLAASATSCWKLPVPPLRLSRLREPALTLPAPMKWKMPPPATVKSPSRMLGKTPVGPVGPLRLPQEQEAPPQEPQSSDLFLSGRYIFSL
jgi:hypothetical protein